VPFYTQLPPGTLSIDAGGVVSVNTTALLNTFADSDAFDSYDLPGDQGTGVVVTNGDPISLRDTDATDGLTDPSQASLSGTYLGDVTLSTADITLLGIEVSLNPIQGELLQSDGGDFYIITDDPIVEDGAASSRLGLTVTVPGIFPLPDTVIDVDLGGLSENLLTAPIATLAQSALDGAIVTMAPDQTGTLVVDDAFPCFVRGTEIQTSHGPIAVEKLQAGDLIMTKDHGLQPIRWIGSRKISKKALSKGAILTPIRIDAGALGEGKPEKDLIVSPQHRILVRSKIAINLFGASEVLVAAKQLLFLHGINYCDDLIEVEYFHFMFDEHEVVFSNGAETESLYIGSESKKSLGKAALQEIYMIFPELRDRDPDFRPKGARQLLSGRQGRKLAQRHASKKRPLVEMVD